MIIATLIVTMIGLVRRWWRRRGSNSESADWTSSDFPAERTIGAPAAAQTSAERATQPIFRRSMIAAGAAVVMAGVSLLGIALATVTYAEC